MAKQKTTLIIARHGNTFGPDDTPTRVGVHTNLKLVESGREQGRMLGEYLKRNDMIPQVVYSSVLKRAEETAQLAIEAMNSGGDTGMRVWIEAIFNEIDYGPDENKPEDEVIARIGKEAIDAWNKDATVPPGWKVDPDKIIANWGEFAERCLRLHAGQTVMVVTSNGIARFAPHLTGNFDAFAKKYDIKLSTGALAVLEHDGKAWKVKSWNVKPKDWLAKHAA